MESWQLAANLDWLKTFVTPLTPAHGGCMRGAPGQGRASWKRRSTPQRRLARSGSRSEAAAQRFSRPRFPTWASGSWRLAAVRLDGPDDGLRLASTTVESRWAMTKRARPFIRRHRASCTSASGSASSAEVGSSRAGAGRRRACSNASSGSISGVNMIYIAPNGLYGEHVKKTRQLVALGGTETPMTSNERNAWIMLLTSIPAYLIYVVIVVTSVDGGAITEAGGVHVAGAQRDRRVHHRQHRARHHRLDSGSRATTAWTSATGRSNAWASGPATASSSSARSARW